MNGIILKLALRWCIKPEILEDVYFMLINDPRFFSQREPYGIKYVKMSLHLKRGYRIELNERQLRYLVREMRKKSK